MKLNKKKELYVNAIVGGKGLYSKNVSTMKKKGLITTGSVDGRDDFNFYHWQTDKMMECKLKYLREIYSALNDS
jgi:hypothetical protein